MPIYEYKCDTCQQLFEQLQKTHDTQATVECPSCKGTGHKVMSNTTFVLKGGGWYVTDYGNRKGESTKESAAETSGTPSAPASDGATATPATAPATAPCASGSCAASTPVTPAVSTPASTISSGASANS